jgi:tetraacyldisaccharide 4'-kinase
MRDRAIHHVWESSTLSARVARELLRPASWIYGSVVSARNMAYDHGVFASHTLAIPAVSVGNLSVGGTGKTPVAAYVAARLAERGMKPAIVTRGYGGDEPLVHAKLNPGVPVIVGADRVRGALAAREAGCNIAVLDDAFQHRRARRNADIVLLSADLAGPVRSLPAGPWREPLTSLARASLVVVTRKSASQMRAKELLGQAMRFAPQATGAVIFLGAGELVKWSSGETRVRDALQWTDVLAISAIGDPAAFGSQLRQLGATVTAEHAGDHHAYTASDATALARRGRGFDMVICTLKDAVKLGPLWPAEAPPLWYLSQRVELEAGGGHLDHILTELAEKK